MIILSARDNPSSPLMGKFFNFYRPQRSWGKIIFSEACVKNSVHGVGGRCGRGACMMGGHVWQGACMAGGLCVCGGGHAWQGGVCMAYSQ